MSSSLHYSQNPHQDKLPLRVAINGFGRIGRNILRAMLEKDILTHPSDPTYIELVAINDIADPVALTHLLKYDSTHGRLRSIGYDVELIKPQHYDNDTNHRLKLTGINSKNSSTTIELLQKSDPTKLPWRDMNIDVVLECSGHFRSYAEASKHRTAGAKQVIIGAAPFDEVDACVVMGVNDEVLSRELPIISGVSCTTQALVPLIATLDKAFGVKSAMMTEIHAVTADQNVLDQAHRDFRRARAAGFNIVPTTSSSIRATERVLPSMSGKINGHSIRVPTINVASIDVTFTFDYSVELEHLKNTLIIASQNELSGIMAFTDELLVSNDFIHQSESLIVDGSQTLQVGGQYKVFAWYDNEWGYANRLLDMCHYLAKN